MVWHALKRTPHHTALFLAVARPSHHAKVMGVETLTHSIDRTAETGAGKSRKTAHPLGYLAGAALAGAFVGIGCLFMLTGAAPLYVADSVWTPLVMGGVFGIGLIFIVFGGGELATSGMMIMPLAAIRHRIAWPKAAWTLTLMLAGNFIGSAVIAGLGTGARVFARGTDAHTMLDGVLAAKIAKDNSEIFFRAILCNILVCMAIWTVTRMTSEIAQCLIIAWAITAFVAGGFEHVIANMTTFLLGLVNDAGGVTVVDMGRNLLFAFLGNLTGGAVFVGGSFLAASRMEKAPLTS